MKQILNFYERVKGEYDSFEKEYDGSIKDISAALNIIECVNNAVQRGEVKVNEEEFLLLCKTFYRMFLAYPVGNIYTSVWYVFDTIEYEHMTVNEFADMNDAELKDLAVHISWQEHNGML